jgi:GNAT superfamily N-acetyltransferase
MSAVEQPILVGGADPDLEAQLSRELDIFNLTRTGSEAPRELTLKVTDEQGGLVAGLSGWTWGTCAAIAMVWVREDRRGEGWGTRLMAAVEEEARERGCQRVAVSSFTFQAPAFYQRLGYVETGRTVGLPLEGWDDVHMTKLLRPLATD